MPIPSNVITNKFTVTIGSAAYECEATDLTEMISTYGGDEVQTACGVSRTPLSSTITGITATIIQGLDATSLFRVMREGSVTGSIVYSGTASDEPGATNPVWTAPFNGYTKPAFTASASGGYPTTTVEFSFSAEPTVDVTPA